jgi:hypothetical protein
LIKELPGTTQLLCLISFSEDIVKMESICSGVGKKVPVINQNPNSNGPTDTNNGPPADPSVTVRDNPLQLSRNVTVNGLSRQ